MYLSHTTRTHVSSVCNTNTHIHARTTTQTHPYLRTRHTCVNGQVNAAVNAAVHAAGEATQAKTKALLLQHHSQISEQLQAMENLIARTLASDAVRGGRPRGSSKKGKSVGRDKEGAGAGSAGSGDVSAGPGEAYASKDSARGVASIYASKESVVSQITETIDRWAQYHQSNAPGGAGTTPRQPNHNKPPPSRANRRNASPAAEHVAARRKSREVSRDKSRTRSQPQSRS